MSTGRDERGLAEIRALAQRLDEDLDDVLKRAGEARDQLGSEGQAGRRPVVDGERRDPLIAFVHIPKTAGGTVTSMFATAVQRACDWLELQLPVGSWRSLEDLRVAGQEVGITYAKRERAKRLLGAVKESDRAGRLMLRRDPGASVESGI